MNEEDENGNIFTSVDSAITCINSKDTLDFSSTAETDEGIFATTDNDGTGTNDAKYTVENWYTSNLQDDYSDYIVSTNYCVDMEDVDMDLKFYLYTGYDYWSGSAFFYMHDYDFSLLLDSSGSLSNGYVYIGYAIFPIISLNSSTQFIEGTGSKTTPYVIE